MDSKNKRKIFAEKDKQKKELFLKIHHNDHNRILTVNEIFVMLGVSESSVTAHIPKFKNAFKTLDIRWAMQKM